MSHRNDANYFHHHKYMQERSRNLNKCKISTVDSRDDSDNLTDLLKLSTNVSKHSRHRTKLTVLGNIRRNKQLNKWPSAIQQLQRNKQRAAIIAVQRPCVLRYDKKPSYRWGTARRGRASWNLVKFCTNVDDLYLKSSETRLLPIRL